MCTLKIVSISILLMTILNIAWAEELVAFDLLNKYSQNQDRMNSSVIVKFLHQIKGYQDDEIDVDRIEPSEVRLGGQKCFGCINFNYKIVNDVNVSLDEMDYRHFQMWDGKRYMQYYDYGTDGARANLRKQNISEAFLQDTWPGSPLFGIRFHTAERIDTVLRKCTKMSVRDKLEAINSEPCYVIDANSSTAAYTIWLNPNHGYNISQATIVLGPKSPGAFYNLPENESRKFTLKDVQFQQYGNICVPTSYTAYWEHWKDGTIWRKRTVSVKVIDIVFNPDHNKLNSFVPKMRIDTIVKDRDNDLVYIWDGNKLKADIDELIIEQLDKTAEQIMKEGAVPSGLRSIENELVFDEPNSIVDEPTEVTEPQTDILSESHSYSLIVLVPIGLLVIGIVGWQIFGRIKT